MAASKIGDAVDLERSRRFEKTAKIYKADGKTSHQLAGSDNVRIRFWDGVDESTAFLKFDSSADTANGSSIVIDSVGNESADPPVPASVTITIEPADAQLVTIPGTGDKRELEITVVDSGGDETVVKRVAVNVKGSAA